MIITIIGSVQTEESVKKIESIKAALSNEENTIHTPFIDKTNDEFHNLLNLQRCMIDHIYASDIVIAIPKYKNHEFEKDAGKGYQSSILYNFGESTSYEIAIAEHFKIPVLILDNFALLDYYKNIKK